MRSDRYQKESFSPGRTKHQHAISTHEGEKHREVSDVSPPFAAGELPFHELQELRLGDVRARVPAAEKRRELLAVEGVQGHEVGLAEGFDASRVG